MGRKGWRGNGEGGREANCRGWAGLLRAGQFQVSGHKMMELPYPSVSKHKQGKLTNSQQGRDNNGRKPGARIIIIGQGGANATHRAPGHPKLQMQRA